MEAIVGWIGVVMVAIATFAIGWAACQIWTESGGSNDDDEDVNDLLNEQAAKQRGRLRGAGSEPQEWPAERIHPMAAMRRSRPSSPFSTASTRGPSFAPRAKRLSPEDNAALNRELGTGEVHRTSVSADGKRFDELTMTSDPMPVSQIVDWEEQAIADAEHVIQAVTEEDGLRDERVTVFDPPLGQPSPATLAMLNAMEQHRRDLDEAFGVPPRVNSVTGKPFPEDDIVGGKPRGAPQTPRRGALGGR